MRAEGKAATRARIIQPRKRYFFFAFGAAFDGAFRNRIVSLPATIGSGFPSLTGDTKRTLEQRRLDSAFGLLIAIAVTV